MLRGSGLIRGSATALGLTTVAVLAACTSAGSSPTSATPDTTSAAVSSAAVLSTVPHGTNSSPAAPSSSGSPDSIAARVFASMSERERVGQLLMVDSPSRGVASATRSAITRYHVGSVILDGTNTSGRSHDRSVTRTLDGLAPKNAGLFIATDQEGGEVQRLQGSGFSRIPSGVTQGTLPSSSLQSDAHTWGNQLRKAGVNVDLAPVLDTVPSHYGSNPPIGDLDREYGHTTGRVRSHGVAFAAGMAAAGVDATAKHFPGLGRVHGNTDTTAGVTDTVTTRHDAYLAPFTAAVKAHVPFVMISTAIYSKIDPSQPAAFSPTIVTGMLRGDLGFRGVIISDDLGVARQVGRYSVGARAVDFVKAGGDMVLTVDAGQAEAMTGALLARAVSNTGFKKKVDAAALLVLEAKQARGLLRV